MHKSRLAPEEILKMARQAAIRYRRRCWWADEEELRAVAALAIVDAMRIVQPEGDVHGYLWRAAVVACRNALLRASAPVSASKNDLDSLRGLRRASLSHLGTTGSVVVPGDGGGEVRIQTRPHESREVRADEALDTARWEARTESRLRLVLERVPGSGEARAVLLEERRPRDVADELGTAVRNVYRAARRAREAISADLELYELIKERVA